MRIENIQVKGFKTERDVAKWSAFPHKLRVIKKTDISTIKKGGVIEI